MFRSSSSIPHTLPIYKIKAPQRKRPPPSATAKRLGADADCRGSPRPERARRQLHGSSSVSLNKPPPKICPPRPQTLHDFTTLHPAEPRGTTGSTEQPRLLFGSVRVWYLQDETPLVTLKHTKVHCFEFVFRTFKHTFKDLIFAQATHTSHLFFILDFKGIQHVGLNTL